MFEVRNVGKTLVNRSAGLSASSTTSRRRRRLADDESSV